MMQLASARSAVVLMVAANLVAVVLRMPATGSHGVQTHLYPIALYSGGVYTDAVSDIADPHHRVSSLTSIRHFALVHDGRKIGDFDVRTLEVRPTRPSIYGCGSIVTGTVGTPNPPGSALWFRDSSGLAISSYHSVPTSSEVEAESHAMPGYRRAVLAAARTELAQSVGVERRQNPPRQLEISSLVVMDLRHDGGVQLWAKVIAERWYVIVWIGDGEPRTLRAETFDLAGGSQSLPVFVDNADIDGDGVDEVVIRDQAGNADAYEIDKLTPTSVRRVFQGPLYGC